MKKVLFAIIGCGYIAHRHAKVIAENPLAELVGVYDIDTKKALSFARVHQTKSYDTLQEILDKTFDVSIICTPNGTHSDIAVDCLKSGKNVLVEKPMDISSSKCEHLILASFEHKKDVFVVKQNRFNPPVQYLKNLIDANLLGKISLVSINCFWNRNEAYYAQSEWRGKKLLDGGILFTQFSHFIDILYFLFGEIESVLGFTSNTNHQYIEFEDNGVFSFVLKNKILGNLTVTTNAFSENMEGSFTVFSENATIKVGGKYLNTIEYFKSNLIELPELEIGNEANNYGFYQGSMSNHDKVINNVIMALNGQAHSITSAQEGKKVVEMIEQFYKSTYQK